MSHREILYSAKPLRLGCCAVFFITFFLPLAEPSLVLKKDPVTQPAALLEEGAPDEQTPGTMEADHISGEALPGSARFQKYVQRVDQAVENAEQGLYDQAAEKLRELFQKKGDTQGVTVTDEYLAQSFPE